MKPIIFLVMTEKGKNTITDLKRRSAFTEMHKKLKHLL